jgi:hypothetical protein
MLGGDRVPDASTVGLAHDDAVLKQGLHVMADGRLAEVQRFSQSPDECSPVLRFSDEPEDARARRISECGEVSGIRGPIHRYQPIYAGDVGSAIGVSEVPRLLSRQQWFDAR